MNLHLLYMRKNARLSRADVARRLGVHPATVGYWERGDFTPSDDYVVAFATVCRHRVEYLILDAGRRVKTVFWPMA